MAAAAGPAARGGQQQCLGWLGACCMCWRACCLASGCPARPWQHVMAALVALCAWLPRRGTKGATTG